MKTPSLVNANKMIFFKCGNGRRIKHNEKDPTK